MLYYNGYALVKLTGHCLVGRKAVHKKVVKEKDVEHFSLRMIY